ncbi:hypothetical protein [Mesorhizobium sp.]|uniref:hypothetical protein n=1 Tax=Mesorhizobium sp. TaxID=1871066 RepID=UPI000FE6F8BB|nr:hypothetical protein [Mesorhizobium sp.]RWK30139.1 MAG: hypothetical protein EOR46_32170 [Mesorhizobium sp.]RWK72746.1 MAG: hypothetical protein EOR50_27445 [Mesorhizobium sp.]RWK77829.1 MAG: hypothetical protein EOR51_25735 [Mesorhizobium sp.]RWL02257.1 MAG: hypothetical protein EOR55_22735 [Mesorhizobium sp.]RWL08258.1 MAG: hypothetical protein EOR56_25135 [Mesorhizobium sp.]
MTASAALSVPQCLRALAGAGGIDEIHSPYRSQSTNSLNLASTALLGLDECVIRYRAGGAFTFYSGEIVTLLQCRHKSQ